MTDSTSVELQEIAGKTFLKIDSLVKKIELKISYKSHPKYIRKKTAKKIIGECPSKVGSIRVKTVDSKLFYSKKDCIQYASI